MAMIVKVLPFLDKMKKIEWIGVNLMIQCLILKREIQINIVILEGEERL